MPKKKKKAADTGGMSNRDCVKGLKSKNLTNVHEALDSELVKTTEFLANKGGLIPLVNLLVQKAKEKEVVRKALAVLQGFLTADSNNVVVLFECGYKGASKWAAAEAVLPLLKSKPKAPDEDGGLSKAIFDSAWTVFSCIVEVVSCLPEGGKNDKHQSSFLVGGSPVSVLMSLVDDVELLPAVLNQTSTIAMSESDNFVTSFSDLVLASEKAARLVEIALDTDNADTFHKILVTLLQLSKSEAVRAVLAPAGVLEVLSRALKKGFDLLSAPKSTANIAEMQWFNVALETFTIYMCEVSLDAVWPAELKDGSDEVHDALVDSLGSLIELLSLQSLDQARGFVSELIGCLNRLCDREPTTVILTSSPTPAAAAEDEDADRGGGEADEASASVGDQAESKENEEGDLPNNQPQTAAAPAVITHERTPALKAALFLKAFSAILSILPDVEDPQQVADLERLLFTLLYHDGESVALIGGGSEDESTAPSVYSSLNTLLTDAKRGPNSVVGARLLAHISLNTANFADIATHGTFEQLLGVLVSAEDTLTQGHGEFLSRVVQVINEMCRTHEYAIHLAEAESGVAVIKGLFWILFDGPKEIIGEDALATARNPQGDDPVQQSIDSQMQAAAALASITSAGDEGTEKVLDGANALFEKIEDPENSDLLQQGILELFSGLVNSAAGRAHTLELLGQERLVSLIVDRLADDSASYTKIKAAVGANTALLMLPPVQVSSDHNTDPTPADGDDESKQDSQDSTPQLSETDLAAAAEMRNSHDTLLQAALSRGVLHYLLALKAECPSFAHADGTLQELLDPLISYLISYGAQRFDSWTAATSLLAEQSAAATEQSKSSKSTKSSKNSSKANAKPDEDEQVQPELPPFSVAEWATALNARASFPRYNLRDCTPLHVAIIADAADHALDLLEHGARCDTVDGIGYTPVILALVYGETKVCATMTAGPRDDVDVDATDELGNPVLKYAFMSPSRKMLNALLDSSLSSESLGEVPSITGTNTSTVQRFLDLGVDCNVADDDEGDFPLHWVIKGVVAKVHYQFADFELQSSRHKHTHFGPESNVADRVATLLQFKARVDVANNAGETPLHAALINDEPAAAEILLAAGANPNLFSAVTQRLPLHVACASGSCPISVVQQLVTAGVGIPLRAAVHDNSRQGLDSQGKKLHEVNRVVTAVFADIVAPPSICQEGASVSDIVNFCDKSGNTAVHYICGAPMQLADHVEEDETPPREQLGNRTSLLQYFLSELKAGTEIANAEGRTPAHFAVKWTGDILYHAQQEASLSPHASVVNTLAAGGPASAVGVDTASEFGDEFGDEFGAAAEEKCESPQPSIYSLVSLLSESGANMNAVDTHKSNVRFTPLHYALERSVDLAYFMLTELTTSAGENSDHGTSEVNAFTKGSMPPTLHIACARTSNMNRRLAVVGFLIQQALAEGRSVDQLGFDDEVDTSTLVPALLPYTGTALHMAAQAGSVEIIHNLLLAKADVAAQRPLTPETPTALFMAVNNGHAAACRELVEAGADYLGIVDDDGRSAIFAAVASRKLAVVEALFDAAASAVTTDFPELGEQDTSNARDPLAPSVIKNLFIGEGDDQTSLVQFAEARLAEVVRQRPRPSFIVLHEGTILATNVAGRVDNNDLDDIGSKADFDVVEVEEHGEDDAADLDDAEQEEFELELLREEEEVRREAQGIYDYILRKSMTNQEWIDREQAARDLAEQEAAAVAIQAQVRTLKAKRQVDDLKKQRVSAEGEQQE